ncbi:thiol reductant ABC exporter subunit CydD [Oceanibaculum indicum]|uniref:ATP-binding cassette subfamily C protein CydD n=1 Tax=Oceanibaculum indicum TaxID=526216 RepID=A0A420WP97_9PROT|nr:thiol reductant ABC exporter subunit CydD [Oceanibaculum indicum]RKQ72843.1 ATP-binding cassette subfamily C protein CydD [Oceanibaculum indicum]
MSDRLKRTHLDQLVGAEGAGARRAARMEVLAALLWIPAAALLAMAIDGLVFATDGTDDLPLYLAGFLAIALLRGLLVMQATRLADRSALRVQGRLRDALASALARQSPFDTGRVATGQAAATLTDHVAALGPWLTRYQPSRLKVMLVPAIIALAVLPVSWAASIALLLAGPLIPIFMALIGQRVRIASERQLSELGTMNAYLLDRLQGLTTIRLLGAGGQALARLEQAAQALRIGTMRVLRLAFLSSAVLELFAAVGVALVAVYVGFSLLGYLQFGAYDAPLTLAEGLFILLLAPDFFLPMREFAASYHDRATAEAAGKAIAGILESDRPALLGEGAAAAPLTGPAHIRLINVRFGYDGIRPVLAGLDLDIPSGEKLALVGPSGSGKSTILALIAGLLRADAGSVEVAGQALTDETADGWRTRLAWVGQRPYFLHGSLRRNLTLGHPDRSPVEIADALHLASAGAVVARLPRGDATLLGEAGQGISGGEGQRLAVARAALRGADIILADEPTAHLDAETAEAVVEGLFRLAEGRTLIIATHDEALAARCDRIVRLHP